MTLNHHESEQADARPAMSRRAFFFLGTAPDGSLAGYFHLAVVLGEGLKHCGWEVSSDVAAWQTDIDADFLFPGEGVEHARNADLIVFGDDWFRHPNNVVPAWLANGNIPVICLERSDLGRDCRRIHLPQFRRFDLVLRTHANRFMRYPVNVAPAVFGVSDRIAHACSGDAATTRRGMMWNFRRKGFPHSVRNYVDARVKHHIASQVELLEHLDTEGEQAEGYEGLMRAQTQGRHYASYYESLRSCLLCACFGGWFLVPVRQKEAGTFCMLGKHLYNRTGWPTSAIAQWDSWRLWEAFAAGAAVVHVDFEKHGFMMPGPLPVAMKHYIAADLRDPQRSLNGIFNDESRVREIGEAGRQWAMEFYTSKAQAHRVIQHLGLQ